MSTKSLPISNKSTHIDGVGDGFDKVVNDFLNFLRIPIVSDVLRLGIIVYGATLIPKLSEDHKLVKILAHPLFRILAIFLLLWSGNNNPTRSLLTAIGIVIIINTISGRAPFDFEDNSENFAMTSNAFNQSGPMKILNDQGFSRYNDLNININNEKAKISGSSDDPITGTLATFDQPKVSSLNPVTPYSNDATPIGKGDCAPVRSIEIANARSADYILNAEEQQIPMGVVEEIGNNANC